MKVTQRKFQLKLYFAGLVFVVASLLGGCKTQQQIGQTQGNVCSRICSTCYPARQRFIFEQVAQKHNSAVTPVSRNSKWWLAKYNAINARVKKGNIDLIFVGDSITDFWTRRDRGLAVWEKYYSKRHAANLGISADRTQHVLWRLDHGNIDGINPKLAVVMIGTNNSNGSDNTAEEIADGIIAICAKLRHKLPNTKILLLDIFPRGAKPSTQREKNAKASLIASRIADNKYIFYYPIGCKFLKPDGTLTRDIMPDLLHPSPKGYEIWAKAIEPMVRKLMGENK